MQPDSVWDNPLVTRYASPAMSALWSASNRSILWRKLWIALAEAQQELGLLAEDGTSNRIKAEQLSAMRSCIDQIDFVKIADYEKRFRHDVMAHVHAFGDLCPIAKDIIHLGATSCYVTDNAELILMRQGLTLLRNQLVSILDALASFAQQWKELPTLGFTHFQPAQLTTVGKRATLWMYDLVLDVEELNRRIEMLRFRGAKGTTGTQASFLELFRGDHTKVRQLDKLVAKKMGFEEVFAVTGQTYSRKVDSQILDTLSGLGQSAHKAGSDMRLLQHLQEVEEPFEKEQIGSSAMAYKRNPMRAERMCGLARFVMNLSSNAADTAATQWFERTLDDSVNRRLSIPQAFLTADGMLKLYLNIASGLVVHPAMIEAHLMRHLPFMATENILMQAVVAGGDRQELHERIRQHSHAASAEMKMGKENDLLSRLQSDMAFSKINLKELSQAKHFVGRAPEQVTEFLQEVIDPILKKHPECRGKTSSVHV